MLDWILINDLNGKIDINNDSYNISKISNPGSVSIQPSSSYTKENGYYILYDTVQDNPANNTSFKMFYNISSRIYRVTGDTYVSVILNKDQIFPLSKSDSISLLAKGDAGTGATAGLPRYKLVYYKYQAFRPCFQIQE